MYHVLCHAVLYCTALHCTALHCIVHSTALHYNYFMVSGVPWHGVGYCGEVCYWLLIIYCIEHMQLCIQKLCKFIGTIKQCLQIRKELN